MEHACTVVLAKRSDECASSGDLDETAATTTAGQLISGSALGPDWISWPKFLPKAAGGGMANVAANLDGSVLTTDDGGQLEAADDEGWTTVRTSTSGAARRRDRMRRLR